MTTAVVDKPKLVLPTVKSEVDNRWISQKIVMIGQAGIGKSEFWSHGDKTLYIQTEAGLNHLRVMKIPVNSWDDFREVISAFIQANQNGNFPYDTIVIDTIDRLKDYADDEAISRGRAKYVKIANEINSVGDIPNGTGWMWSQQLIEKSLDILEALPCCVAVIGHQSVKEVKTPTSSFHKQTISIGGKTGESICSWPDHLLNIEASFQGSNLVRVIRTLPTNTIEAKSRGGIIKDGWKWSSNSKENYEALRKLFN